MILHDGDIELIATGPNDPEVMPILDDPAVLVNLSEARLHREKMPAEVIFKIRHGGQIVGEAALKGIRWFNRKAQFSVFLRSDVHGKGVGTRAVRALLQHAFATMNLVRVEAEVLEFNAGSRRLVEKLGFVHEGTLRQAKYAKGRYWNILVYGLLREEFVGGQPAGAGGSGAVAAPA